MHEIFMPSLGLLHEYPGTIGIKMHVDVGPWFSLIVVLLFTTLLLLRIKFPAVSIGRERAILLITAILFFGVCYWSLPRTGADPASPQGIRISGSRVGADENARPVH